MKTMMNKLLGLNGNCPRCYHNTFVIDQDHDWRGECNSCSLNAELIYGKADSLNFYILDIVSDGDALDWVPDEMYCEYWNDDPALEHRSIKLPLLPLDISKERLKLLLVFI